MRLTKDQKRSIDDGEWWQSLLPPGWRLFGWTYRSSATAFNPSGNRVIELDAELIQDIRKEYESDTTRNL